MTHENLHFSNAKDVLTSNYCISIIPINDLGRMQKEIFKKLLSRLLQDAHGLPHQILAKAQLCEFLTHHWREQF